MKTQIILLFKYMHRFGVVKGFLLFIQLRYINKEEIYLSEFGKVHLRRNTSDFDVFNQVMVSKEYDLALPDNPAFIIDGGANIGLTSMYLSHKYPHATIVSIEPDEKNFLQLKKNTAGYLNIQPLKKALWGKEENVYISNSNSADSHTVNNNDKGVVTETVTVSSLLNEYKYGIVDLLKMDVEGAEKEIFETLPLDWLSKVKVLAIEVHDRFKLSVFKALTDYKYTLAIKGELLIIHFLH
jgi:FkbM family methyltransferase